MSREGVARVIGGVSVPETWNRHGKVIGGKRERWPFSPPRSSVTCRAARARKLQRSFERWDTFFQPSFTGTRSRRTGGWKDDGKLSRNGGNKRATGNCVTLFMLPLVCRRGWRISYTRHVRVSQTGWFSDRRDVTRDTRLKRGKMWADTRLAARLPLCTSSMKLYVRETTAFEGFSTVSNVAELYF